MHIIHLTALLLAATLGLAHPALAVKPVTYPGGVTVMNMNDSTGHQLHVLYTFTPRFSAGARALYNSDDDYTALLAEGNVLLHRWNNPDSQANIFANFGAGAAYSDHGDNTSESEPAYALGLLADWEDRRYYTSYENQYMDAGRFDASYHQAARVGVAPYVGDYGDLHTWLMLQVDHHPEGEEKMAVTPLIRLFQGNYLGEAGISNHGDILLNLNATF